MCFNEQVSYIVFILGTLMNIFNVWFFNYSSSIIAISIALEYILLIQLFEGFVWGNSKKLNKVGVQALFNVNVLTPFVVYVILMSLTRTNSMPKIIASALIVAYVTYVLYVMNNRGLSYKTLQLVKCQSGSSVLRYPWWNEINGGMYLILLAVILLLLRPFKLALGIVVYLLISLLIMYIVSVTKGNFKYMYSLWCFTAFTVPFFIFLYGHFALNLNKSR